LVLGIALGFGDPAARDVTLRVAEALYAAQLQIIHWTLCALPFGIFCIFSEQIANMGLGIFRAMGGFVLFSIALAFVTSLLYVGVIARVSRLPFLQALAALKRVISVSFVTASSFASIPVMIEALVKGFRRDVRDVNLIVPLAVNLNRQGSSIYMAFAFMFVAQLYSLPIPIDSLLLVWGLCALSGMIPAGIVGLIPIVFTPVGLPIEVGITLLLAVEVLLDPVFTVVNALGFCSTSLLFSRSSPKSLGAEEASP
ncbi:MAG: dicarboxylate/amino acid:cation symporter, partial [Bacteriovoracia bacterium]